MWYSRAFKSLTPIAMTPSKDYFWIFIKGAAMGAANVIPGVSGGTIAFITGIYERLIDALKSFDPTAIGHLLKFRVKAFAEHVDLGFLVALGAGVLLSILTLAQLLEFLFLKHPVAIWSFFFGLILASIYAVGKMVKKWGAGPIVAGLLGAAIALAIALLTSASENDGFLYAVLCGVVAICSMIVPGLSGSFVLLLMGNYMLAIGSISDFTSALKSLEVTDEAVAALKLMVPFGIGCVVGLVALSHLLSWIFKKHHDVAVALMTGFITGSLLIIWPWKNEKYLLDEAGAEVLHKGEVVITGYDWFLPGLEMGTFVGIALMVVGFVVVLVMDKMGSGKAREGERAVRMRVGAFFAMTLVSLGLAGCGGESGEGTEALRVGMELAHPPFEMRNPQNEPDGISVRMAEDLAASLGRPLKIEDIQWAGIIPALKSGRVDIIISSMTRTEERAQSIDFSDGYVTNGLCLLVPKDSRMESATDLEKPGLRVAVKLATTGHLWAQANLKRASLMVLDDAATCALEVAQGKADTFVFDQISIFQLWKRHEEATRPVLHPIREETWAVGIRKSDDAMRESVNAFLKGYREERRFDALAERYMAEEKGLDRDMGNT